MEKLLFLFFPKQGKNLSRHKTTLSQMLNIKFHEGRPGISPIQILSVLFGLKKDPIKTRKLRLQQVLQNCV